MLSVTRILLAAGLSCGAASAFAADDTSADAASIAVANSDGLILRVPINERGEENTSAAEMRLHNGERLPDARAAVGAWADATDVSTAPRVGSNPDSSTCGWSSHSSYGWSSPYYSYSYSPYYYSYGTYYNYGTPYYYTSYPYRYYYYPSLWY